MSISFISPKVLFARKRNSEYSPHISLIKFVSFSVEKLERKNLLSNERISSGLLYSKLKLSS